MIHPSAIIRSYILPLFSLFYPFYCHREWITQLWSRCYQYFPLVLAFSYQGIDDPSYETHFSFGKKIICLKSAYDREMANFFEHWDTYEWDILRASPDYKKLTAIVYIGKNPYVVKRMPKPRFLKRCFSLGRVVASWNHAYEAFQRGYPTVRPTALLEEKEYVFCVSPFLGKNASQVFRRGKSCVKEIQQLLCKMENFPFTHSDLSLDNIILTREGAKIVDLDFLHTYPRPCYAKTQRELREKRRLLLDMTLLKRPECNLSLDFKSHYTEAGSDI